MCRHRNPRLVLIVLFALVVGAAALARGTPAGLAQPAPTPPPVIAPLGAWNIADPSFAALPGAQAYWGVLDRAAYRIEVPDAWNGDLVMFAHGYQGEGQLLTVVPSPNRAHYIANGFAWAASSCSANGYAPDICMDDTLALRAYFIQHWGQPAHTYLEGLSMGGHVVVASLEQHPGVYDGALSECGVVMQEQRADYLAAYTALADWLAGSNALSAATPDAFAQTVQSAIVPALGTPDNWTDKGKAFENILKNLTGGSRPFRHAGMADFYAHAFPALAQPLISSTSPGGRAATSDYFTFHADPGMGLADVMLNAQVVRKPADPLFRNADTNPTFSLPTGRITVPLMTYHTTGDHQAFFGMEINYRKLVDAAGRGDLLVQRAVRAPTHCQFQPEDLAQGFDDLVNWVEHGVKPDGDDFLQPDLTDIGRRWTHKILPGDNEGY